MSGYQSDPESGPEGSVGGEKAINAPGTPTENEVPVKEDGSEDFAGANFDPRSYGFWVSPGKKRRKSRGITGFGY